MRERFPERSRRSRHRLLCATSAALLLGAAEVAHGEEAPLAAPAPLTLEWCAERAEQANPELVVDAATAEAMQARVAPAGALEDPRIRYEASNVPREEWDFDTTPLSGQQLGLAQKFPFPGLLGNRKRAARSSARVADLELEQRRHTLAADVERAWAELGFAQRALEITDRNVALLRQLSRIAEARYGVGGGLQQDVLRAQVELTALLQERLQREAEIRKAEAALAALLDLPSDTHLPTTAELADASEPPPLAALLARLEEQSPFLRARAARIEGMERLHRAAQLEGYPDFDIGLGYRIRERVAGDPVRGDDFLSAGVTVRLPINRSKWRARVAERHALVRRAKAEYRAERARLRQRVRDAYADLVRADSELELLETGLVPQARQSLESSRSGYEVGRVDFPSLLDSQVRLLRAELRRVREVVERRSAFAALEAAIGEDLR